MSGGEEGTGGAEEVEDREAEGVGAGAEGEGKGVGAGVGEFGGGVELEIMNGVIFRLQRRG